PERVASASVGYLMPWGTATAAAVAEALRNGIRVRAAGGSFELAGRSWGVGTAIVRLSDNADDVAVELGRIAAAHGAEVVPIDDSYVEVGTSLGSASTRLLREPNVLLVYDAPGDSYSTGWARYVLERRYGQAVAAVRTSSLGDVPLADYDVIVFPSGNYGGAVSGGLVEDLRRWVAGGGTLVTIANATGWATRVGLLATHQERRGGRPAGGDVPEPPVPEQPIEYLDAIVPADEAPPSVPGAILNVLLDTDHWLAAGTDGRIGAIVEGSRVFAPLTLDEGTNVGRYAELDELVA